MERLDLTGAVLDGRYRVIEPVAEGAMGVVYRAERVKLGRIVAVKILHDSLPNELSSRRRFEIEAMAMAKLEHPHCVAVLDVGLHDDHPFVVMDFVSGQNLKEVIAKSAPLPPPRATEIVRQLLSGLAHAHEHGIIHRDIKPANIVLSQKAGLGDHVKILDFGLARLSKDSSLTTGIVVGTPSYMAPEQIRGTVIDSRVDIYASGVVLFELLTGKKPFHSEKDDPIEVCSMHLKRPPPKLADILPTREFGELEDVVAKALAKSADARYASAVEFAAALDAVMPRRPMTTPTGGVPISPQRLATPPVGVPILDSAGNHAPSEPPARASTSAPTDAVPRARPSSPSTNADAGLRSPSAAPTEVLGKPVPDSEPVHSVNSSAIVAEESAAAKADAAPAATPRKRRTSPYAPTEPAGHVVPKPARKSSRRPATDVPGPRAFRKQLIAFVAAVLVVGTAVIVLKVRGGASSSAPADAGPSTELTPGDPGAEAISRATELAGAGRQTAALELLLTARKSHPDDPRLAYAAGKLYFERYWWSDGLKQLRDTVRLDPGYRSDPELLRTVLRGFITTPRYNDELASFLRDELGASAKAALEETARDHPNPQIRQRAANELKRYR